MNNVKSLEKIKIAILGACCSRDIFNRKFCPDWRQYFDVVFYQFQPSFISLNACPIPYVRKFFPGELKQPFDEMLQSECTKDTYNSLLSVNPEVLLIDFYSDVINGVIPVNDCSYIVEREKEWKDNINFILMKKGDRLTPSNNHDKYMNLWKEGFDIFMRFMRTYLPNTLILINSARCTNVVLNDDGSTYVHKFGSNIKQLNGIWEEMDQYAVNTYGLVQITNEKEYFLTPNYNFGFMWIVHYCQNYYQDRLHQIVKYSHKGISREKVFCQKYGGNILLNGNCAFGTAFWKHWSEFFSIQWMNEESVITYGEDCLKKKHWAQCWSLDVETNALGTDKYTVSFDCCVERPELLGNDFIIFGIRTFEKKNFVVKNDSVQDIKIFVEENGISEGEWFHYEYTFIPKGKYISVGPFIAQNGYVKWKNISLYRHVEEKKSNTNEYHMSPAEKILLKPDDFLIDVNYEQITNIRQIGIK